MSTAQKVGEVTSFNVDTASAKVEVNGRETDTIPVLMIATKFKRHFIPLAPGDQVAISGEIDAGHVTGSFFHDGVPIPSGVSETREVIEYSDGTRIVYDIESHILEITGANISIQNDVSVGGNLTVGGNIENGGNITSAGVITDSDGNNGA
ncbi:putative baseplate assembly protein V [Sulfurovum sp. enrichment culture clone C5]|uniref:Putative baseplate assembly protein V n=1 Tax=Sulfurovum sp. enrichment culture clone C5 TaxID=497650 RepID=A0A0S4XME3_9BACT|nr:putative baseplate assembly protein V [Sulfurovum sp. enrichment culture clone C5]